MSLLLGFLFIQDQLAFNSMNTDECTTAGNILKLVSSTRLIIFYFVIIVEIWSDLSSNILLVMKLEPIIKSERYELVYTNAIQWVTRCNHKCHLIDKLISVLVILVRTMLCYDAMWRRYQVCTSCLFWSLNKWVWRLVTWIILEHLQKYIKVTDNKSNNTTCVCFEF